MARLAITLLFVIVGGCVSDAPPGNLTPRSPPSGTGLTGTEPPPFLEYGQGITGRVVRVTLGGNELAVSVPLHVFRGSVKSLDKPDPDHPQLVDIFHCQGDGIYRVHLAPGTYTVAPEIGGKLCPGRDGWRTVVVKEGEWVDLPLP